MHSPQEYMSPALIKVLNKQHYALFGHSAVKTCHWTKNALTQNRFCYKCKFYGIQSHRCIQMTPMTSYCEQKCVFCWRPHNAKPLKEKSFDDPKTIVEQAILMQKKLLSGFWSLVEQIGEKKLKEAMNPKHVALSLSGEPTFYPLLSELVKEFHSNKFSTFVVSNGLRPKVLKEMVLPTQLYLSVEAWDESSHKKINLPLIKDSWKKLLESIELFPSLKTRKVIRLTLVKGLNDSHEKEFAELIKKAQPDFLEVKGYMWVGFSRNRLKMENMPLHEEVLEFSKKLNKELNYTIIDESKPSRVVLLSSKKKKPKIDFD